METPPGVPAGLIDRLQTHSKAVNLRVYNSHINHPDGSQHSLGGQLASARV